MNKKGFGTAKTLFGFKTIVLPAKRIILMNLAIC